MQLRAFRNRHAAFEHRGEIGRLFPGEGEIGSAHPLERTQGRRLPTVPCRFLALGETLNFKELCGCLLLFAGVIIAQLPDKNVPNDL